MTVLMPASEHFEGVQVWGPSSKSIEEAVIEQVHKAVRFDVATDCCPADEPDLRREQFTIRTTDCGLTDEQLEDYELITTTVEDGDCVVFVTAYAGLVSNGRMTWRLRIDEIDYHVE